MFKKLNQIEYQTGETSGSYSAVLNGLNGDKTVIETPK